MSVVLKKIRESEGPDTSMDVPFDMLRQQDLLGWNYLPRCNIVKRTREAIKGNIIKISRKSLY